MSVKVPDTTVVHCSRFGFIFQVTHRGYRQLTRFEVIHPDGTAVFTRKSHNHPYQKALSFFVDGVVQRTVTFALQQVKP